MSIYGFMCANVCPSIFNCIISDLKVFKTSIIDLQKSLFNYRSWIKSRNLLWYYLYDIIWFLKFVGELFWESKYFKMIFRVVLIFKVSKLWKFIFNSFLIRKIFRKYVRVRNFILFILKMKSLIFRIFYLILIYKRGVLVLKASK